MNVIRLIFVMRGPFWVAGFMTETEAMKIIKDWTEGKLPARIAGSHTLGAYAVKVEDIIALHTAALEQQQQPPPGTPRWQSSN